MAKQPSTMKNHSISVELLSILGDKAKHCVGHVC